jgi:DGQHR domain-containing protein
MAGLAMLRDAASAQGALYVSDDEEILENEVKFALGKGITVWNKRELAYYKAVVKALGKFAKYEIINSLGISTAEEQLEATVIAVKIKQPNSKFGPNRVLYVFSLPAEKLLKTCTALRRARGNVTAYQRVVSAKRLPTIADFLRTPQAVLPTNLVVHLGSGIKETEIDTQKLVDNNGAAIHYAFKDHQLVALTIPLRYASLELIDGQHRLFGFVHTPEDIQRRFNLAVLGVKNLSEKERSDTFVAINDNAKRVDPNLVAFLQYTDDEKACQQRPELMAIKIAVGLNKTSPFKDAIKLHDLGEQHLTLRGISGYDLKGLVSDKGLLKKYYPSNKSEIYIRVLRQYFSTIKTVFKKEWNDPKRYIVQTNRGLSAFLKLLKSILKTEKKKIDHKVFKKYLTALKKHTKTWETAKLRLELQKSYVGAQGWKDLHRDMVKRIKKEYPSFVE